MARFAEAVGQRVEAIRGWLEFGGMPEPARSYKADGKPGETPQVTLERILADAEVPPENAPNYCRTANDMDAIEIARQEAAERHAALARLGRVPESPYEFAVRGRPPPAGGMSRGLRPPRLICVAERPTLIPADMLILHQSVESAFDQAFLVAHEIGHFLLGDAIAEPVLDSDPARPAESSPTGADRVVDYGRRQRREVQMDLFAREFLLPRELMRRLHLEQLLTASDIATRFGAPFDVVAQQLFDALLLPPVTGVGRPAWAEKPLTRGTTRRRGTPG